VLLGLGGLLILAIPAVLILLRRRRSTTPNYTAEIPTYSVPTQATPLPLPLPPAPATTVVEQRINDAFYPTQAHRRALAPNSKSADEPLDMFEAARQHPETYGNTHIGQAVVTPLVRVDPIATAPQQLPQTQLEPLPPATITAAPAPSEVVITPPNADDSATTMHIKH
jgi:hypothetical protein